MNIKTEEKISYQHGNFKSRIYFMGETLFEGKYRVLYKILYRMNLPEYSDYIVSNALKKFGFTEVYSDEKYILFFEDIACPVKNKRTLLFDRIKSITRKCYANWLDLKLYEMDEYDPADDIDWDTISHNQWMGRC